MFTTTWLVGSMRQTPKGLVTDWMSYFTKFYWHRDAPVSLKRSGEWLIESGRRELKIEIEIYMEAEEKEMGVENMQRTYDRGKLKEMNEIGKGRVDKRVMTQSRWRAGPKEGDREEW